MSSSYTKTLRQLIVDPKLRAYVKTVAAREFVKTPTWKSLASDVVAETTFRYSNYPTFDITSYFAYQRKIKSRGDGFYAFVGTDEYSLSFRTLSVATGVINRRRNPPRFGHAGLVRLEGEHLWIYQMNRYGLRRNHLLEYLKTVDDFAIVTIPMTKTNLKEAHSRVDFIWKKQKEKPGILQYDYPMELDNAAWEWIRKKGKKDAKMGYKLYCSELVYQCARDLATDGLKVSTKNGVKTFSPQDVYDSGDEIRVTSKNIREALT